MAKITVKDTEVTVISIDERDYISLSPQFKLYLLREFQRLKEEKLNYDVWLKQLANNSDKSTVSKDWVIGSTFLAMRKSDRKLMCKSKILSIFAKIYQDMLIDDKNK
ncbi:MAG: hypothetical protein FWF65_08365 [Bacteroidetes bacterium]|nr:hypothetical protein [Bacteroidota bacterium]MCL1969544.1 hypothetical protein [Bacteroidota bacterium]